MRIIPSVTLAILLATSSAVAQEDKAVCVESHVAGQRAQRTGRLRVARDAYSQCTRSVCPPVIQSECFALLSEVDNELASIVVEGTDDGRPTDDLFVYVDGERVADSTKEPITVDPGERTLRYETRDGRFLEQRVIFVRREKMRRMLARFSSRSEDGRPSLAGMPEPRPLEPSRRTPAPEPPRERPTPALVYVLGGVGLVGLSAFGTFGALGTARENELGRCAPRCDGDAVSGMYDRYLAADVSLSVGIVALGAATVLWLTR